MKPMGYHIQNESLENTILILQMYTDTLGSIVLHNCTKLHHLILMFEFTYIL